MQNLRFFTRVFENSFYWYMIRAVEMWSNLRHVVMFIEDKTPSYHMLTQMFYKKAQVVLKFYPPTSPSSYLFNNYIRNGKMFCGSNLIFWFTDHSALVVFFPIKEILLLALTSKWQCVCGTRILNAGQKTWMSNKI